MLNTLSKGIKTAGKKPDTPLKGRGSRRQLRKLRIYSRLYQIANAIITTSIVALVAWKALPPTLEEDTPARFFVGSLLLLIVGFSFYSLIETYNPFKNQTI